MVMVNSFPQALKAHQGKLLTVSKPGMERIKGARVHTVNMVNVNQIWLTQHMELGLGHYVIVIS